MQDLQPLLLEPLQFFSKNVEQGLHRKSHIIDSLTIEHPCRTFAFKTRFSHKTYILLLKTQTFPNN